MKPLNIDKTGCSNISSNCVVWQGPNIPCINLCKGDSVTEVVYKLATELCELINTFDISTYTLSCFAEGICPPQTFREFVQLLIDKVCTGQISNYSVSSAQPAARSMSVIGVDASGDTIVEIAPAFYYYNEFGDLVTTMTVTNYAVAIGNRVSNMVTTITNIESTLTNHNNRLILLETAPPPTIELPTVTPVCVIPEAGPTAMNVVLAATEQQFCELRLATGTPTDIFTNIQKQIPNLNEAPTLSGVGGNMASLDGWNSSIQNEASSIGNIWLTIADMRVALQNIITNYIPNVCSGINLTIFASYNSDTQEVSVFVNGVIPGTFVNTESLGTLFTVRDSYNSTTSSYLNIIDILNSPYGGIIPIGNTILNGSTNLTITAEPNFTNTVSGSQCQSILQFTIIQLANCPEVVYTPALDSISFQFTSESGNKTYIVELWNDLGTVLISSQTFESSSVDVYNGSFVELVSSTSYKLRVKIDINNAITTCAFTVVTTLTP